MAKTSAPDRPPVHAGAFVRALPRGRQLVIPATPGVMGIINVTPDSFSDGGLHLASERAIEAALRMVDDGAVVIDVGGESTRPGAEPVSTDVELERVLPVIEGIRQRSDVAISIDTMKPAVAEAAIAAGADLVNDVSGLRDEAMVAVVASTGAAAVIMHMRGEPRTMQNETHYDDVVAEVAGWLSATFDRVVAAGVAPGQLFVDPGIGFGKTFEHNLEILAHCSAFSRIAPVVIGASRKGFIGHLTGQPGGAARAAGSLAAVAAAHRGGAALVRVHDVRETVDFCRVLDAIAAKERA
jgi:dihydropteroate synthase